MKGHTSEKELQKLKNLGAHAKGDKKEEAAKMKEKEAAYEVGARTVLKAAGYTDPEIADLAWDTAMNLYLKEASKTQALQRGAANVGEVAKDLTKKQKKKLMAALGATGAAGGAAAAYNKSKKDDD